MIKDITSPDNDNLSQGKQGARDKRGPDKNARKPPKKITESYLHNAGLYYLQRFAASSAQFRRIMLRKVKRSCDFHNDQDPAHCAALVDALVIKFEKAGLLGDQIYTRGAVTSLRRRGKSKRHILGRLKTKGIEPALALEELTLHDNEHFNDPALAEHQAALAHARKKKLGPFRISDKMTPEKELASMARAGFSYETARSVLNLDAEEMTLFCDTSGF
ncbi:MAG: RecX family transcriptional regulator [Alphaproteobacteria bacterium]|nr:RecX family transcriptional regulator [Alphaproteobacteria bacterium]